MYARVFYVLRCVHAILTKQGAVCRMALNLKNFKGFEGQIYCLTHTPNVKATAVADDLKIATALSTHTRAHAHTRSNEEKLTLEKDAPKRNVNEGARGVQKGTGEKPQYGIESLQQQNALST